ncbi:MAG: hypothetical protein IJ449_11715 [Clostridia bacterium]|nr:hypothetical protein [Clostridia bacterium]
MTEFITDRTQADVDRVKELHGKGWDAMTAEEQAEWEQPMKGAYNYTDLNRIYTALHTMCAELGSQYEDDMDTTWNAESFTTRGKMNIMLAAVRSVGDSCGFRKMALKIPLNMDGGFDYETANAIEKLLKLCEETLESRARCGEIYCGEV